MKKTIRTVGLIIEFEDKILTLLRSENSSQPNQWSIPAGKVKSNETDIHAIIREVYEETKIQINEQEIEYLGEHIWHFPEVTVEFPTFRVKLKNKPDVILEPKEHKEFIWETPHKIYQKENLIHGEHDLLEIIYDIKRDKTKNKKSYYSHKVK